MPPNRSCVIAQAANVTGFLPCQVTRCERWTLLFSNFIVISFCRPEASTGPRRLTVSPGLITSTFSSGQV